MQVPYQTNKAALVEKIATLTNNKVKWRCLIGGSPAFRAAWPCVVSWDQL